MYFVKYSNPHHVDVAYFEHQHVHRKNVIGSNIHTEVNKFELGSNEPKHHTTNSS